MTADNTPTPDTSDDDPESAAVALVMKALKPLKPEERQRVLGYISQRVGLHMDRLPQSPSLFSPPAGQPPAFVPLEGPTDIRSLKTQKTPRSDNEMAAVMAYYLAELAPEGERKTAVEKADIEKYFLQAQFPLPKKPNMTLPNAFAAGYFDRTGTGRYKLNPVGYNLVTHGLPAGSGGEKTAKRPTKPTKRAPRKKA